MKYSNRRFKNEHGKWDSQLEYYRYLVLLEAEKKGIISRLERQKEYILIPAQKETVKKYHETKKGVQIKLVEKVVEKACTYKADFVYYKTGFGTVIEDTKGFRTKDYIIKRKLIRYLLHNVIREVNNPNEPV